MEKLLRAAAWIAILLGLLVAGARYTVLRWWQVPLDDRYLDASIRPTLRAGDWVLLWRLTTPGFGDLVLCPDPDDPSQVVIGRIAGFERDEVRIDGDDVYLNNKRMAGGDSCPDREFSTPDPRSGDLVDQHCTLQRMGGVQHAVGQVPDSHREALKSNHVVPQGQVFLVSDNRLFPFDSRHFGSVPRQSCKETLFFRLVSKDGFFDVKNRLSLIR